MWNYHKKEYFIINDNSGCDVGLQTASVKTGAPKMARKGGLQTDAVVVAETDLNCDFIKIPVC